MLTGLQPTVTKTPHHASGLMAHTKKKCLDNQTRRLLWDLSNSKEPEKVRSSTWVCMDKEGLWIGFKVKNAV